MSFMFTNTIKWWIRRALRVSAYHWWKCRRPGLSEVTLPPSPCSHTHPGCPSDPSDLLQRSCKKRHLLWQPPTCVYHMCVCVVHLYILKGQCLATEVGGCLGVEDGAAWLRGFTAQSDVSPAAQDVALSAWTPLCYSKAPDKSGPAGFGR